MTSANCELREFESFLFFLTAIATVGCLTGLVCGGIILVVAKDQAGLDNSARDKTNSEKSPVRVGVIGRGVPKFGQRVRAALSTHYFFLQLHQSQRVRHHFGLCHLISNQGIRLRSALASINFLVGGLHFPTTSINFNDHHQNPR